MPLVKFLRRNSSSLSVQRSLESQDQLNLHTMMSKTIQFDDLLNEDENSQRKQMANADDLDSYEIQFANPNTMKGLEKFNEFYIKPLLVRPTSARQGGGGGGGEDRDSRDSLDYYGETRFGAPRHDWFEPCSAERGQTPSQGA